MNRRIFLLGLLFSLTVGDAWAATRLKLGTLAPKGTSFHLALQHMGEQWKQLPDGAVALTIYTDGTMGSESDMVRRMRLGQLQAAMLTVAGLSEIDPGVTALQYMPMMFHDLAELDYVRSRLEPLLTERMRQKGFIVLFWGNAGWVRFFSRVPATSPEEFRQLKIFALATDNQQIDLMKRMGYKPVPLEFSDVLTALQTGMIDAVPTAPFAALAGQFYPIASHMLDINWVPLVGATIVTQKTWESIPPAAREAMKNSAAEIGNKLQARIRNESDEAVEAMKKRGLTVHPLPDQTRAVWNRTIAEIYPQIRGGMVPADMFDTVQRLVAEYRNQ